MTNLRKLLEVNLTIALLLYAVSGNANSNTEKNLKRFLDRKIFVSESLKAANPYLSFVLKRDYKEGASLAVREFCKIGKCPPLKFHFGEQPSDLLMKDLVRVKADVVIGFAFSNNAALALKQSKKSRSLIITPTASYDELFDTEGVLSLGIRASETAGKICKHIKKLSKKATLVYPRDVLYAKSHVTQLKKKCENIKISEITYLSTKKNPEIIADEISKSNSPIVFPGYVHDVIPILQKLNSVKFEGTVYGTSQWVYSIEIIKKSIDRPSYNIFAPSDYFPNSQSKEAKAFRKKYFEKYKKQPNQFATAVYDAVKFTYKNISVCSHKNVFDCFNNSTTFVGASGSFKIHNGNYYTESDLHKWVNGTFQPTIFKE